MEVDLVAECPLGRVFDGAGAEAVFEAKRRDIAEQVLEPGPGIEEGRLGAADVAAGVFIDVSPLQVAVPEPVSGQDKGDHPGRLQLEIVDQVSGQDPAG